MIQFYKDQTGRLIDPTLFSKKAEKLAKDIHEEGIKERPERNKRTQIRKFYDEVVRLNSIANNRSNAEAWDSIIPYVNMLIAKAAYAEGRKLVTGNFTSFMKDSIGQIRDSKDLAVFTNLFEAFMGFYKQYDAS
ncbi:MAG TPA: type III-A CRISPR-associated protein Csm2 [Syntrophales bacterium]|nr:type III-A CRISPR-associated protein Csm2 [Syntrophales bacterium]